MQTKISKKRLIDLCGLTENNKIKNIKSVFCMRRPDAKYFGIKPILGLVSHPSFISQKFVKHIDFWCHPFRNPNLYLPTKSPKILLSESDFLDPKFVYSYPERKKRFDFFCFVLGGKRNVERKGINVLLESIPVLCGKYNLRGIIINYSAKQIILNSMQKKQFKRYKRKIKYLRVKLHFKKVAELMAGCRFGFFPNIKDCSPLLLAECLVRNMPALVNENIWGGWKYINNNTGALFNLNNLSEKIDFINNSEFNSRDSFMSRYGLENTSIAFAKWGRENKIPGFDKMKKVFFCRLKKFCKRD